MVRKFQPGDRVWTVRRISADTPPGRTATVGPRGLYTGLSGKTYLDIIWDQPTSQMDGGYYPEFFEHLDPVAPTPPRRPSQAVEYVADPVDCGVFKITRTRIALGADYDAAVKLADELNAIVKLADELSAIVKLADELSAAVKLADEPNAVVKLADELNATVKLADELNKAVSKGA